MDKKCYKCGETKSTTQFSKCKGKKDGLQTHCKRCKNEINKQHYNDNKEMYYLKNKRRKKENRQFLYTYLKSCSCIDCGESTPECLDFDHIAEKETNVARLIGHSIKRIQKEIAKCEVRCANCHRKKTARDFNWYSGLK